MRKSTKFSLIALVLFLAVGLIALYATAVIGPPRYMVTFYLNDGTSARHGETVAVRGDTPVAAPTEPTRDGRVFLFWATDPIGGRRIDLPRSLTQNLTLYARWDEEPEPDADEYDQPKNEEPATLLPASRYDPIIIEGDEEFVRAIENALDILRDFPEYYEVVNTYTGRIIRGPTSMEPQHDAPIMRINTATIQASSLWLAGMMVHEAYHSKLYFDYRNENNRRPPRHVWAGPSGEIIVTGRQREFLVEAGAPQYYLQHVDYWLDIYREQLRQEEAETEEVTSEIGD